MRADTRGANLVEYILIVGLVGLVAIAGFKAFGASAAAKTAEQAKCVETLDCAPGAQPGDVGTQTNAVTSTGPKAKPPYDDIEGGKDATYQPIDGDATITGQGDGSAVHPNDVSQGQIGDCYLMASLAEIAMRDPDVISNAVRDNGDGTYTVTFYEKAPAWKFWDGGYHKVEIRVTSDFPSQNGNPVFAQPGDTSGDQRELWPMLIEKAYAQWKGDYNDIGHGGDPGDVMAALTGHDSDGHGDMSLDDLADSWEAGDSIVMWTPGEEKGPLFDSDTLYGDHAYFVSNVDREAQTVSVRNPWGWGNAEITMSYEEYRQHFTGTSTNPND